MTLHEIYATLLRRGMPVRTGLLRYTDGWRLCSRRISDGEWVVSESDAADLLTMHALRWFNALGFSGGSAGDALQTLEGIIRASAHLEPK